MLKIKVLCVGKIKEDYFEKALAEYKKRLSRFCDFCIDEIPESRLGGESFSDIQKALAEEAKVILKKAEGMTIVLDRLGKQTDSVEFAQLLKKASIDFGKATFVIGSSHGVDESVKQRADCLISFGKITLPHQLFRVVLVEQIYRGFGINNNSPYHK